MSTKKTLELLDDEPIGAEGFGELTESALEKRPVKLLENMERQLQADARKAAQSRVSQMSPVPYSDDVRNAASLVNRLAGHPRKLEEIPVKMRLQPGGFDAIRRCTPDDIIRFAPKVVARFRERFPRCSEGQFIAHYTALLPANWAIVLCSDTAIAAASAFSTYYEPELIVQDSLLCSVEPQQGGADLLRLYKRIESWARSIGAVELTIGSMTEKDLGPLAARLGYNMISRGFSKRLKE